MKALPIQEARRRTEQSQNFKKEKIIQHINERIISMASLGYSEINISYEEFKSKGLISGSVEGCIEKLIPLINEVYHNEGYKVEFEKPKWSKGHGDYFLVKISW